ncbi:MAG TPA: T9SS type B sorting domain-containing protein [Saprospiraceae bacterium]|nr:T9SS type B sorting domain-containing protein [Saprospiraceae bacterium]
MRYLLLVWIGLPLLGFAQQPRKLVYDFNQCRLTEQSLSGDPLIAQNPAVCACGLEQEAIQLNGQSLILPTASVDTFFHGNFSFGFSVMLEQGVGNLDLLSKMRACNTDTLWSVVYQPKDSNFVCTMQQGFDKIVQLVGKADATKCWQQLVFTRSSGQIRMYVNGVLKDESNRNFILRLNNKSNIQFNNSPCSNVVNRSNGLLDRVFLANYSMNASEVQDEYVLQDQILTRDTLIFTGASFTLRAISDCASQIRWTPAAGLSSASQLEPLASPVRQTRYYLNIQHSFCSAFDSILVRVIDTSGIDCSAIRLPTAFSPNGDGLNDRFFISNAYIIEKLDYFDLMDRNGALIRRIQDPAESWDGSWNGKDLAPGTYYYRIAYSCKGENFKTKGSFFLMR